MASNEWLNYIVFFILLSMKMDTGRTDNHNQHEVKRSRTIFGKEKNDPLISDIMAHYDDVLEFNDTILNASSEDAFAKGINTNGNQSLFRKEGKQIEESHVFKNHKKLGDREVPNTSNFDGESFGDIDVLPLPSEMCPGKNEVPSFIRHRGIPQDNLDFAANFVRKMGSLESCAEICRQNVEPFGGQSFQCWGFTYLGRGTENSCEFFSEENSKQAMSSIPISSGTRSNLKSNFFEKICLEMQQDCQQNTYVFEAQILASDFSPLEPFKVEAKANLKGCLESCLKNHLCHLAKFNKRTLKCELFSQTSSNLLEFNEASKNSSVNAFGNFTEIGYYVNICAKDKNRCGTNRLDYSRIKNSESTGFVTSIGEMQLRECLRRCADERSSILCRAVEYRQAHRDCFVVADSFGEPLNTVPSGIFDVYEPICLDPSIEQPCPGDYAFEHVPQMSISEKNLTASRIIKELTGKRLESCMNACILEQICMAFIFNRNSNDASRGQCQLLTFNSRDLHILTNVNDTLIGDYFELACDRPEAQLARLSTTTPILPLSTLKTEEKNDGPIQMQTTTNKIITMLQHKQEQIEGKATPVECKINPHQHRILIEVGRTLRMEYRKLHHLNVRNASQCERLCLLSKIDEFKSATQPNPNYDLYAFQTSEELACENETTKFKPSQTTMTTTPTNNLETTETKSSIGGSNETKIGKAFHVEQIFDELQSISATTTTDEIINLKTTLVYSIKSSMIGGDIVQTTFTASPTPSIKKKQTTLIGNLVVTTTENSTENSVGSNNLESQIPFVKGTGLLSTAVTNSNHSESREMDIKDEPTFAIMPYSIRGDQLKVEAYCNTYGVNITFELIGDLQYTGVLYALDRFHNCHLLINNKSAFSFYINRPSQQPLGYSNWCAALESNDGELKITIVLANDLIMQSDVTTKDDLMYEISCNYSSMWKDLKSGRNSSIKGNVKLRTYNNSGEKLLTSNKNFMDRKFENFQNRQRTEVWMDVLRDGQIVDLNVYLGERLSLSIMTNINDVSKMDIIGCNASRVGGYGKIPDPFMLIGRHGCSLSPKIIEDMDVATGFQAFFTVFRIDGSDRVDLICTIIACDDSCSKRRITCPKPANLLKESQSFDYENKIDGEYITIEKRLRINAPDELPLLVSSLKEKLKFNRHRDEPSEQQNEEEGTNLMKWFEKPPNNLRRNDKNRSFHQNDGFCLNPIIILSLLGLFVMISISLSIALFVKKCRKKAIPPNPIYPFGTEMSSQFYVPRIFDRYVP